MGVEEEELKESEWEGEDAEVKGREEEEEF